MPRVIKPAAKGVDAIIYLGSTPLAGQKNAKLNRQTKVVDVTNEIEKDWARSLPATKSWSVTCSGMFIKDSQAFSILENAYVNGTLLSIELRGAEGVYTGSAYLTQFPLSTNFSDTFTYSLTFVGSGALELNDE